MKDGKETKELFKSICSEDWLAATPLHVEADFNLVKGHKSIPEVMGNIRCQKNQEIKLAAI